MRFWISWYQPTEDYRPLTYPPNEAIKGWWNSGQRLSDDAWTLCALVDAENAEAAMKAVRADWPEAAEWRFCEEREPNYVPGDRFPLSDWMKSRLS